MQEFVDKGAGKDKDNADKGYWNQPLEQQPQRAWRYLVRHREEKFVCGHATTRSGRRKIREVKSRCIPQFCQSSLDIRVDDQGID